MERNITLDYFKLFLSILVIVIHLPLLFTGMELVEWTIRNGIARMAVPCFFIINGYFIGEKISDGKFVKKYIFRLLLIYAVWTSIYFTFFKDNNAIMFIFYWITGYVHLWYLMALIVGVILLYLFKRCINNNWKLLIVAVILAVAAYLIQEYSSLFISDAFVRRTTFRNGIFVGFPFVFFGYFIKSMEEKLTTIKTTCLLFVFIGSLIGLAVETCLAHMAGLYKEVYLSLIVLCPASFLVVLRYSKYSANDGYISKLATGVYLIHPLILMLALSVLNWTGEAYIILLPAVLFLSMAVSAGIILINKRIRIFL